MATPGKNSDSRYLISPDIPVTMELIDGEYFASNDELGIWGVGKSATEAWQNFSIELLDLYDDLTGSDESKLGENLLKIKFLVVTYVTLVE